MPASNGASPQTEVDLEKGDVGQETGGRSPASNLQDNSSIEKANGTLNGDTEIEEHESSNQPKTSGKRSPSIGHANAPKNNPPKRHATPSPAGPGKKSIFQAPPVRDPDPAAERLADDETPLSDDSFHRLMGMRRPTSADEEREADQEYPIKLAIKGGLFKTICDELRSIQYKYRIFNVMTYALLGLQVVIGAIFIILGALGSTRINVAISVLGAISTAVGGALALMKGQGLPNRLRQARNRMSNVVFEAQELYWDFRTGRPILYSDVKKIREDYLRVLEEMRKNHPDTWTPAATETAQEQRGRRR